MTMDDKKTDLSLEAIDAMNPEIERMFYGKPSLSAEEIRDLEAVAKYARELADSYDRSDCFSIDARAAKARRAAADRGAAQCRRVVSVIERLLAVGSVPSLSSSTEDCDEDGNGFFSAECPIRGIYCQQHGSVHGQEAEELRLGIERMLEQTDDDRQGRKELRRRLTKLLDDVDARDSLAWSEAQPHAVAALPDWMRDPERVKAFNNASPETIQRVLDAAPPDVRAWGEAFEAAAVRRSDLKSVQSQVDAQRSPKGGAMNALEILGADRDEWKRRAEAAETKLQPLEALSEAVDDAMPELRALRGLARCVASGDDHGATLALGVWRGAVDALAARKRDAPAPPVVVTETISDEELAQWRTADLGPCYAASACAGRLRPVPTTDDKFVDGERCDVCGRSWCHQWPKFPEDALREAKGRR